MMFTDFLKELEEKEIKLTLKDGKISYWGPEESVTPELIDKLKNNKGKLIKYLWNLRNSNLMPIQPEGEKAPLFLVHGDVGNYSISEFLGPDQPIYGFFHLGSNGEQIRFKSVKEMAKAYLDQVFVFSPKGPYYLCGFSFGGIIAFEMAIQLQKLGYKVALLSLIDSVSPLVREPFIWHNNIFKIIRYNILRPVKKKIIRYGKLSVYKGYFLFRKPIPINRRKPYIWDKYTTLFNKYSPEKFNGKILLFKTLENKSSFKYLGWENLVNNIELFEIHGKHTEIFWNKESVGIISKEIKNHLTIANKLRFKY